MWSIVCAMEAGEEEKGKEEVGGGEEEGGGSKEGIARPIIVVHSCCVRGGIAVVLLVNHQ